MSYVLHSCYSWLCGAPLQSNFKMMNKALVRRECCFLNTPFRNMFRPRSTIYRAPEMRSGLSEKLTPGSFDQSRRSRRQKLPRPFDRHRPPKGQKGVRAFGHKCDESCKMVVSFQKFVIFCHNFVNEVFSLKMILSTGDKVYFSDVVYMALRTTRGQVAGYVREREGPFPTLNIDIDISSI